MASLGVIGILAAGAALVMASPVWDPEPVHQCPTIPAMKNLLLEQVAGDWRLAYIFLGQVDEGLNEEDTCVVMALLPSSDAQMEISLFVDARRADHVDRSAIQFPADIISPAEWKIYTPLSSGGFFHARVIQASHDHMVITFCGEERDPRDPSETTKKEPDPKLPDTKDPLDWRGLFEEYRRRKRNIEESGIPWNHANTTEEGPVGKHAFPQKRQNEKIYEDKYKSIDGMRQFYNSENYRGTRSAIFHDKENISKEFKSDGPQEMHMWTAVLVKHNDISALKFVEYAAVLMKHGFDVTQGELVSFGKCPIHLPHQKDNIL